MRFHGVVGSAGIAILLTFAPVSRAGEEAASCALIRALSTSRISLAEGIRQAEKSGGAAISAKYELGDNGELLISVYVAERGVGIDAEHNVLKELIGSPAAERWQPEVEVFTDVPHVARSSQQLALMTLSPQSLLAVVERMSKDETVVSAIPALRGRRAVLVGRSVKDGVQREWELDLLAGKFVAPGNDGALRVQVRRHELVRQAQWVVEFGCAGAQEANGFVHFRIAESPSGVEKILVVNAKGETVLARAPEAERGFYEVDAGKAFGEPTELWIYPRTR